VAGGVFGGVLGATRVAPAYFKVGVLHGAKYGLLSQLYLPQYGLARCSGFPLAAGFF
jgi:hypothetical protein